MNKEQKEQAEKTAEQKYSKFKNNAGDQKNAGDQENAPSRGNGGDHGSEASGQNEAGTFEKHNRSTEAPPEARDEFAGFANSGETTEGQKAEESDREQEVKDEPQDSTQDKVAMLEDELARAREGVLRKAAEFENLKKRTQKEKTHLFEEARVDAVSKFLPIREDLKRSIEASKDQNVDQGFLDGLKLVLQNFDKVLEQYNVEPIEETGVPFNVDMHDAMLSQPSEEDVESNTVIQVLEPGYKIGDRVIKHAKVIVSQ